MAVCWGGGGRTNKGMVKDRQSPLPASSPGGGEQSFIADLGDAWNRDHRTATSGVGFISRLVGYAASGSALSAWITATMLTRGAIG